VIADATGTELVTPRGPAGADEAMDVAEATCQVRSQLLEADRDPASYAVIEDLVGQYVRIHDSVTRIQRTRLAHADA
jgi:hypothetical protein